MRLDSSSTARTQDYVPRLEDWQFTKRLGGNIERYFGRAKKHQGLKREAHAYRGLGMATPVTASIFTNANNRKLRTWAQGAQTPPDHPLLFTLTADEEEETETPFAAELATTTIRRASHVGGPLSLASANFANHGG